MISCTSRVQCKPSVLLASLTDPLLSQLNLDRHILKIGVHLRLGDSAIKKYSLPNITGTAVLDSGSMAEIDTRYDNFGPIECFVEQVIHQCKAESPRLCVAYVTSDSTEATLAVEKQLSEHGIHSVTMPGDAVHIDRGINSTLAGHSEVVMGLAKDFVDWYMLAKADVMVMSASGFSFTAAYSASARRAVWLPKGNSCSFEDFKQRCMDMECLSNVDAARG